jgi:hypothetical protein
MEIGVQVRRMRIPDPELPQIPDIDPEPAPPPPDPGPVDPKLGPGGGPR